MPIITNRGKWATSPRSLASDPWPGRRGCDTNIEGEEIGRDGNNTAQEEYTLVGKQDRDGTWTSINHYLRTGDRGIEEAERVRKGGPHLDA